MIMRELGRTGLKVSAMGLGCFQFTGQFGVPTAEADALLDCAMASPVNYFDTASVYGFGECEALVGRALERRPDKRAVVGAKLGHLEDGICRQRGAEAYQDPEELSRALKHSLWLLHRDAFDVVYLHEPEWAQWGFDYATGESVALQVLRDWKKQGLLRAIGLGSNQNEAVGKLCATGAFDVVLDAGGINLLARPMYENVIPAAKAHRMGVVVGACFGQGNPWLIRKDRAGLPKLLNSADEKRRMMGKKLARLYDLCDALDCSMIELAMRYLLGLEEIHMHVPGARELAHFQSNLASCEKGPLPEDCMREIRAVQDMGESPESGLLQLESLAPILGVPEGAPKFDEL